MTGPDGATECGFYCILFNLFDALSLISDIPSSCNGGYFHNNKKLSTKIVCYVDENGSANLNKIDGNGIHFPTKKKIHEIGRCQDLIRKNIRLHANFL